MAKGTKRKKPGVGIDFRRVKSKVGKKLPKAQNETDMSFKSKSINLPGQSLTEDKTGFAVSQRNLTTQELLGQISHYNERVRKDALTGLQQLFQDHPQEIHKQTGALLSKLAECIGDTDKAVRAALKELLSNVVLPQLKGDMLGPFVPLVMAHLFSALTSLSEPVRSGALDFLEVFMNAAPKQIMHRYLDKALQHFVELLSPARRSATVSAHSTSSMLKVVKALQSLLSKAMAATSSSKLLQDRAGLVQSGQHSLFQQRTQWPPVASPHDLADFAAEPMLVPSAPAHSLSQAADGGVGVGEVLLDQLMTCWTECAPGQLAAGPELTAVQCMEATLQCLDLLLHHLPTLFPQGACGQALSHHKTEFVMPWLDAVMSHGQCEALDSRLINLMSIGQRFASVQAILKKVTPHVPVSAPAVKPSQQMQQALVNLNLAAAKLLSHFLPMQEDAAEEEEEGWQARLLDYYTGIMEAGQLLPSRQAMSSKDAQGSVLADVCRAALQGVQGALPCVSPARQAALLAAVTSLSSRAAARSALKAACLEFQLALLAKGRAVLQPNPGTGVPQLPEAVLINWLQAIPKLLWDLGSAKPAVTQTALALLHTALRFAPEGSALSSALDSMQPQLCPFYCSLLAPKSSKSAAQAGKDGARALKVVVPGPLAQLPTDSQNLAVDMLYYFPTLHEATARTCALVCLTPIYPVQLALRVLDTLCSTHPGEAASVLISFLVTVLLGRVSSAQVTVSRSRHDALVQAACRAVPRIAPPGKVFQAMEPVLLQHSSATDGPSAWRGIIAAATVCAEASFDSAPQNSPISYRHSSLSAEAGKGPSRGTDSPASSASNLTMTSGFLAALPCVMALYSCHADSAAASHVTPPGGKLLKGLEKQQNPVFKLLKADARLMLPFIRAVVQQGQQSVGQLSSSDVSRVQPGRQSLAQACDEDQARDVSMNAELASQADAGLGEVQADPAGRGGGGEVLAAAEALLSLCKEQALLVQVVELLQLLSQACSTLRAVAMTVGQASQNGAAALRKCDSLATILQGLSGSATGP